jgi:RNase adapter protein RapZ
LRGANDLPPTSFLWIMTNFEVKNLRIVIVTGLSGSGKSTVSRALEDMGFFCVDNLPVALMPKLFEMRLASLEKDARIALVMDLRERDFLKWYQEVFAQLRREGFQLEILFLEASDEALVRRYSQTRRAHPLGDGCGLLEGIHQERARLAELRSMAAMVIDTSLYNVHQLQAMIRDLFGQRTVARGMTVTFLSFGFSRGVPQEADLVMDVRFLPNPYFVEKLKALPGTDPRIGEYLLGTKETQAFLKCFQDLLRYLLPLYEREGKAYLTVAVGCTGGKHRSVVIAAELAKNFGGQFALLLRHRDLETSS